MFFRPVQPWSISQHFGDDMACISLDGKTVITKENHGVCPAGYKNLYKNGHQGIDIPIKRWQPIYAAQEGIVSFVQTDPTKGLGVVLDHTLNGVKYQIRYWHLIALNVNVGEKVKIGSFLGYGDNTGNSSGDHLHFTISMWDGKKYVFQDPEPLIGVDFALKISFLTQVLEKCAQLLDMLSDKARRQ